MQGKAPTYATRGHANANFWEESPEMNQTPAQNALNHHTKHRRTVEKFIIQDGKNWVDPEPINKRFQDHTNYIGIEWTILLEQGTIPMPEECKAIIEGMRAPFKPLGEILTDVMKAERSHE